MYLLLEYASHGNLFKFMKERGEGGLDHVLAARIYVQVCRAVKCLHDNNIIHRDIKPENILLDDSLNAKLCDFGWSTETKRNEVRETFCGTYEYMAPEIFESEQYNGSVDIWSLGILLYELLHGRSPFAGESVFKIFKNILKEDIKFKRDIDPNAADLMLRILKTDAVKRPTIDYILCHSYVVSACKMLKEDKIRYEVSDYECEFKEANDTARDGLTHSSHCSNDAHINNESHDDIATDIKPKVAPQSIHARFAKEIGHKAKVDSDRKRQGLNSSFNHHKANASKGTNMTMSDIFHRKKDKPIAAPFLFKYKNEISPGKVKKSQSMLHVDNDAARPHRTKQMTKGLDKRYELKAPTMNHKANFGSRKPSYPQNSMSSLKSKIQKYVTDNIIEKPNGQENTNIYVKHHNERSQVNLKLFESTPVNETSIPPKLHKPKSSKLISTITRPAKLNFTRCKPNNITSSAVIEPTTKRVGAETFIESQHEWSKHLPSYGSTGNGNTTTGVKKTLSNKKGLVGRRIAARDPFKSQTQAVNKSNINIVINKFYDKAKVYYTNDEAASAQKRVNQDAKQSTQTFELGHAKKSSKTLVESQIAKLLP